MNKSGEKSSHCLDVEKKISRAKNKADTGSETGLATHTEPGRISCMWKKTPQTCSLSGDTHPIQILYIFCIQNAVADLV